MKICIVQAYIFTLSTERDLHVLEQRTHFLVMYVVTLNLYCSLTLANMNTLYVTLTVFNTPERGNL